MQLAEAFEPEQQVAEFVLPAKHTLNGVEPFLEGDVSPYVDGPLPARGFAVI